MEAERQTRSQRRKAEQARLVAQWGELLTNPQVLAEIQTTVERAARLRRIIDLAELSGKADLVKRASAAMARESQRHQAAMRAVNGGEAALTSEEYARGHVRRPGPEAGEGQQ